MQTSDKCQQKGSWQHNAELSVCRNVNKRLSTYRY